MSTPRPGEPCGGKAGPRACQAEALPAASSAPRLHPYLLMHPARKAQAATKARFTEFASSSSEQFISVKNRFLPALARRFLT